MEVYKALKRHINGRNYSLRVDVTIGLAIILLLFPFPVPASVLCIGPGGHIAIEEINATCCPSSGIKNQSEQQPDNAFTAVGDCLNCTDFFLSPNKQGALLESYATIVPDSLADACLRNHIPSDISSSLCRTVLIDRIDVSITLAASAPLRC